MIPAKCIFRFISIIHVVSNSFSSRISSIFDRKESHRRTRASTNYIGDWCLPSRKRILLGRIGSPSAPFLFWFICRSRFPPSQRGGRGFGLPNEKLYLIKRLGSSHDGSSRTRTRKLRRGRWLVTSRGIAGKNTAPMDDESILSTFTTIDPGYLGRFVHQPAEDGSLCARETNLLQLFGEHQWSGGIDSSFKRNSRINFSFESLLRRL